VFFAIEPDLGGEVVQGLGHGLGLKLDHIGRA
jgi:hypothetical protein